MQGDCLAENIIYQATVTTEGSAETYIGLTSTQFKTRYNNHTATFRNAAKRNTTELSKHIWSLKDNNIQYNINWKIITKAVANYNSKHICNLCIAEKSYIIYYPKMASLNERRGIISSCRHLNKYMLSNLL